MKSAKQIALEDHERAYKDNKEKRDYMLNELIAWLEMCIGRYISAGTKSMSVYGYDHRIEDFYDEIQERAEKSGYRIEKVEETWESGWIFKKINKQTIIVISWE